MWSLPCIEIFEFMLTGKITIIQKTSCVRLGDNGEQLIGSRCLFSFLYISFLHRHRNCMWSLPSIEIFEFMLTGKILSKISCVRLGDNGKQLPAIFFI